MNEKIHADVIEGVMIQPNVSELLQSNQANRSAVLRLIKDQIQFLERRCEYINSDPCARFPGCLCGQQIIENLLLDLPSRIDKANRQPSPSNPPPKTTPPTPPSKRPAVTMPVPPKFEFTDARSEAWKGDRRVKKK